jgi:electron transfer flavoprotein beta subunit
MKQVPDTTEVEIDEATGVLKREGVGSKTNPYDVVALEAALRLKERLPAEPATRVSVLSLGPPSAVEVVREAFSMGADDGYLLSDRRFAGSDVLATAYALSQAILVIGMPNLLICGAQTTDGDTGQVGAELAEILGVPHVSYVTSIDELGDGSALVRADMVTGIGTLRVQMPGLLSVTKDIYQPRLPSYVRRTATKDREVRVLTLEDLRDSNPDHYGLDGSATRVKRVFPPDAGRDQIHLRGNGEQLADAVYDRIDSLRVLEL